MGNRKSKTLKAVNSSAILNEKITVSHGDDARTLTPIEAGYRNLLSRALKGDMSAIKRLTNECVKFGILAQQVQEPYSPSVIRIPKHWEVGQWHSNYDKYGYSPWPGDDDGFTSDDRDEYEYWRKHGHHSWRDRP